MKYYTSEIDDVLSAVKSAREGLSSAEAEKRLAENGKNKLAESRKDSLIKRFFKQMADPMIIILLAAALISAITSSYAQEGFADVFIILFVVVVNAVLGVYQESKAEKALEALQEMASATSKVLRGGKISAVRSEDLVVGDVVILEAGDAVPADGRIIASNSMKIEEAALTGESIPVDKFIDLLKLQDSRDIPLGDRKNMVYMGSTVVYGRGAAVITHTGMDTEMGKIADALAKAEEGLTPLQKKLAQLSKVLTFLVLGICAVIFAVALIRAGDFSSGVILDSFMIAVSLAVAAIPEGLVAVVTIVLSIGVTNMSKKNAIIRKLTAVETLGSAQIICSDKTGTLTQNKMTVVEYHGENQDLLATAMALCCDAELDTDGTVTGEPTENALVYWAKSLGLMKYDLILDAPRIGEAPFDSVRKMMSTVHQTESGVVQYTKGAPDEVLRACTTYLKDGKACPLTDEARAEILAENRRMAGKALRVLAAALRPHSGEPVSFSPEDLEKALCFVGLAGMIDPVRPEVKAAIEQCRTAGIRPIMITGDHIDTASAIAKELGILGEGDTAVSGAQISEMSDAEFEKRFRDISVYARVQPEHKVRIVTAWKNAGCVTAMTGDGVNDAPSIKSADIGVGMGITGTDVTKNVADMVLADDNFATIVGAVREGRRIYDNIRKAIQFLLSSNMSEVLGIFVATLLNFTILRPVHLLWINLVTDCFPALALGLERAEPDIMNRRPRPASDGVFSGGVGIDVAYQGLVVALLTLAAYFIGHVMEGRGWASLQSDDGITMAFLTMSMAEIFHSFNMRSQRASLFSLKTTNAAMIFAAAVSLVTTTAVLYIPFLADAFSFEHISLPEYLIALALAFLVIPIVETVKLCQRRYARKRT
ncbi:MAG: cation-translocating P-type ATPase [Oscillospiraceae bacterium]|nr:cation-translocating P-type ATPase [Oscillospiraceae bacterium]